MHDLLHTANRRRTFSELLKKHVAAIHIKNTLSFLQRKIGNILLVNAYDNLLTKDVHTIRVRELAQMAGYESHDYQILKDSLTALVETTLEWNILNAEEEEWGISTMLAQAEIKKGICYYAYSPTLRQKLYNPEIYARINLAIQRKFSSGPALALYENCGRYVGVGSTGKWPLEKVRSLVGISENEYKEFKDLNKWVIKPGIQQVNKNSDILLEVEYYRERRRVVALRFRVQENPRFQKHLPVAEGCISENGSLLGEAPTALVGTSSSIVERLQEFGFSKVAAVAVMKRYGEDYIKENLNIVEKDYQAGKIKDLPRYTAAALRDDYRPRKLPYEVNQDRRKREAKARAEQAEQARQRLDMLRKEFERHRLEQTLDGLSQQNVEALRQQFLKHHEGNCFFERWIKQGFEHRVVQSLFRVFAAEVLLKEPKEGEFEAFVRSQREDLTLLRKICDDSGTGGFVNYS